MTFHQEWNQGQIITLETSLLKSENKNVNSINNLLHTLNYTSELLPLFFPLELSMISLEVKWHKCIMT
jgi:hypothetical protein